MAGRWWTSLRPEVGLFVNKRTSRYDVGALRRIARYLREHEIEFVQSHNDTSHYFTRLCLAFHGHPRPFHICHAHSAPVPGGRSQGLLGKWIDRWLLGQADLQLTASEEMRDHRRRLLRFPADRCIYLPNAIAVPPVAAADTSRETERLEILQVANLHWPKGHANAMHIAGRLKREQVPFTWRVVGRIPQPGSRHRPYFEELLHLIDHYQLGDAISFEGEQDDIEPFLRVAQIGVLTSDSEAFPITLLEYMAAALPVVVTDVGQNRGLIESAQCGAVHPREAHEEFALSLAQLADDSQLRVAWGQAGRQHVLEHYDLQRAAEQLTAIYTHLRGRQSQKHAS